MQSMDGELAAPSTLDPEGWSLMPFPATKAQNEPYTARQPAPLPISDPNDYPFRGIVDHRTWNSAADQTSTESGDVVEREMESTSNVSEISSNVSNSSFDSIVSDHLQGIVCTVEVRVCITQIIGRDGIVPGDMACPIEGHDQRHPVIVDRAVVEAIDECYMLVRLSHTKTGVILEELDKRIGRISEVASIILLYDGSFEILVLKSYLRTLQTKLTEIYQSYILDSESGAFTPSQHEVEYWGLDMARNLYAEWAWKRVEEMHKDSWRLAKIYYTCVVKPKISMRQTRLNWMGWLDLAAMNNYHRL